MDSLAAATSAATGGLPSTVPSPPSSQGGMEDLLPLVLQLTNADQVSMLQCNVVEPFHVEQFGLLHANLSFYPSLLLSYDFITEGSGIVGTFQKTGIVR